VICLGDGVLTIHPAALSLYEPAVIAEAVAMALEGMARIIEATTTLSDDRRAILAEKARDLVQARIISQPGRTVPAQPQPAPSPTPAPAPRVRRRRHEVAPTQLSFADSPHIIAESITGARPAPYDAAVIQAPAHQYGPTDRPMMRGLPLLSAAGHPSHLARIEDPQDSHASTSQDVTDRARRKRQATIVVATVPLVIAERNKTA
jgi:hypothetical protein